MRHYGTIANQRMSLSKEVGTVHNGGHIVYTIATDGISSSPIVSCHKTKKTWSLSWGEIIQLAKLAGIDADE